MNAHKEIIWLLSFTTSLIFAMVISMTVRKLKINEVERWAKPFGRMFWALTCMYLAFVLGWAFTNNNHFPIFDEELVSFAVTVTASICSAASNFFLFRCAFKLWGKRNASLTEGFQLHPKFPKITWLWLWVAIAFFIASLFAFVQELSPIFRLPDALISASCLIYAGWAFYRSISSRRHNLPILRRYNYFESAASNNFHLNLLIAHSAWFFGTLYGVLHIFYGIIPLFLPPQSIPTFDAYVMAFALLLKLGIFIPAYTLLMVIINSHRSIRDLLEEVVNGRKEFLDSDGIVRAIKESLKASQVDLFIKLPGLMDNQAAVYSYSEENEQADKLSRDPKIYSLDDEECEIFSSTINNDQEYRFRVRGYLNNFPSHIAKKFDPNQSIITTPIKHHGAVVGCLLIRLENGDFKESDVQQIKEVSYFISPAIQAFREIAALDRLASRLARLQLEERELPSQQAIKKISKTLFDILSPKAIGISSEIGFEKCWSIIPGESEHRELMKKELGIPYDLRNSASQEITLFPKKLVASLRNTERSSKHKFGKLLLAAKARKDDITRPTLATYHLYRSVVANLVADALFDFARDYFSKVLKEFSVNLNETGNSNTDAWCSLFEETAHKAGLTWAVVKRSDRDSHSRNPALKVVNALEPLPSPPNQTGFYYQNGDKDIFFYKFSQARAGSYRIVPLYLKDSEQTIWLGIGNCHFEDELTYLSPWRVFLERFAEIADAALDRINTSVYKKETAEIQRLAKVVFAHPSLVHQIVNQVRNLTLSHNMLEMAVRKGWLKGNEAHRETIYSLSSSANKLLNLTSYFEDIDKLDTRTQPLYEAVSHALGLWEISLEKYNIATDVKIEPEIKVNVPFYAAACAIADLICNSKDAIKDTDKKNGLIQIKAEEIEDKVLLHLIDNGPGVPEKMRENLLKHPVTSSKSYGKGKGLYLANHLLKADSAFIKLTNYCNPTKFTIYFPKLK